MSNTVKYTDETSNHAMNWLSNSNERISFAVDINKVFCMLTNNRQAHLSSTSANQHSFTFRIENDMQILHIQSITNAPDGELPSVSSSPAAKHLVRRELRSLCNFEALSHPIPFQSWLVGAPEHNHSYFRETGQIH